MPKFNLSDAIKEAFAVCPASKVILETLELRQTGVQDPIYIVKGHREIIAKDENGVDRTFSPSGFQLSLPPENEEGFKSLNIVIDNIDRRISNFISAAKAEKIPVEVVYRPYLSDALNTPAMIPPLVLYLKDIQITTHQVVAKATFLDIVNKKFPSELYTRDRFAGLG